MHLAYTRIRRTPSSGNGTCLPRSRYVRLTLAYYLPQPCICRMDSAYSGECGRILFRFYWPRLSLVQDDFSLAWVQEDRGYSIYRAMRGRSTIQDRVSIRELEKIERMASGLLIHTPFSVLFGMAEMIARVVSRSGSSTCAFRMQLLLHFGLALATLLVLFLYFGAPCLSQSVNFIAWAERSHCPSASRRRLDCIMLWTRLEYFGVGRSMTASRCVYRG